MQRNKVALITGGSRGIGKEIAGALARQGMNIGIIYHQNAAAAQKAITALKSNGVEAEAYQANLDNISDIDRAFESFIRDFEQVDVLINNAGATRLTPFLEIALAEWEELVNLNLRSAFYLGQKCARIMLKNRWGRIVNIGSIGGERLIPGVSAHYAASKAGLTGLTRVMAKELARYNILVNCVAPGLIETDLSGYMSTKNMELFQRFHPLKRMGTVAEVSELVAFLVSEKASYITGETIHVSGGLV